MAPTMESAGGPSLMQLLAKLQGGAPPSAGGAPPGLPPGMMGGPPEPAEGEGGSNPLIAMLLQLLAGQGGGQGMPPPSGLPIG